MFSLLFFALLAAAVMTFTSAFKTSIAQNEAKTSLNTEARLILEKIAWGPAPAGEDREGLWRATQVDPIVTPTEIEFTGEDGIERTIRQNGNNIEFLTPGNPTYLIFDAATIGPVAANRFVDLQFSEEINDVIVVNVVLGKSILGRWHYASLSTQVAIRNE